MKKIISNSDRNEIISLINSVYSMDVLRGFEKLSAFNDDIKDIVLCRADDVRKGNI